LTGIHGIALRLCQRLAAKSAGCGHESFIMACEAVILPQVPR
jgi:hypothetical protein